MTPRLHEQPLVLFTTLAIAGSGLVFAGSMSSLAGGSATRSLSIAGLVLVSTGWLVSLRHLGRPPRAHLALSRVGVSALSTEVAVAIVMVALAASLILGPGDTALRSLVAGGTAAAAIGFLLSLGRVYCLPGQHAWGGIAAVGPLALGVAFGALVLNATALTPSHIPPNGALLTVAALFVADAIVSVARWRRLTLAPNLSESHPALFAHRWPMLVARVAVVDALPLPLALGGHPAAAIGACFLGILFDRIAFYGLATRWTPESEVAHIERTIACLPRHPEA